MDITTNNVPRPVIYACELSEKDRAEFDYLSDNDELVRYRGELHALADFVRIKPRAKAVGFEHPADPDSPLLQWHGIATDSYFSAHVIRYCDDPEWVVIGRVYW